MFEKISFEKKPGCLPEMQNPE